MADSADSTPVPTEETYVLSKAEARIIEIVRNPPSVSPGEPERQAARERTRWNNLVNEWRHAQTALALIIRDYGKASDIDDDVFSVIVSAVASEVYDADRALMELPTPDLSGLLLKIEIIAQRSIEHGVNSSGDELGLLLADAQRLIGEHAHCECADLPAQ